MDQFELNINTSEANKTSKTAKTKTVSKKLMERYDVLFIVGFGLAFLTTLVVFSIFGLIPKELAVSPSGNSSNNLSLESQSNTSLFGVDFTKGTDKVQKITTISSDDLPVRIVIEKAGVDTKIMNPESSSVTFLDNELSKAPVRYPGSGTLSSGNIFVFGHSTGFKVVQNQAFKVFNNIKNLKNGDQIMVYSQSGKSHIYSVTDVKEVSKNDTYIKFDASKPSITLSTCDSFGQASDRYVVSAVSSQ
ncbi:MAG: sortase [bacterium]